MIQSDCFCELNLPNLIFSCCVTLILLLLRPLPFISFFICWVIQFSHKSYLVLHVVHVWNDMIAIKWQNWNLWVIFFFSFGMCIIHRREYVSPMLGSLVTGSYCSEPRCTVVLQERWVWSNCLISSEQAWTAEAHITCIVRWLRRLRHWFESTA